MRSKLSNRCFRNATSFLCATICTLSNAELVIGRTGSLKSPISSPLTISVGTGFDTYIKKINQSGGVNGQTIRVVFRDDEFKPDLTLAAAKSLIEQDNVLALVSPQGTPGSLAIAKDGVLKRNNVAVVGPFTGAPSVLFADNFFPTRASYDDEVRALLRQMKRLAQGSVAYMYYNTGIGPAYVPVITKLTKEEGLPLAASVGYDIIADDPAKQTVAIQEAVKKVFAAKPAAVFLIAVGPTVPAVMTELYKQGGAGFPRYTFSINDWQSLIKNAGLDAAKGVVISQASPYPYVASRKIASDYLKDLKKYSPDATPSFAGIEGYVTARILVEALRRAGPRPTSAKVLRALENFGKYDLGDFVVEYSGSTKRVDFVLDLTIINNQGKLVR